MFLVIILYAILATTFVTAKQSIYHVNPFFFIGIRMFLAGIFLLGYQRVRDGSSIAVKKGDLYYFLKLAFFHIFLSFSFEFWSLQYVTALKATVIFSASPFITAIIAYFLYKQKLSYKKFLGICIGVGGLIPYLMAQAKSVEGGFGSLFFITVPDISLFGAVVTSAYGWFLLADLMKKQYCLAVINGYAMFFGGLMSLVLNFICYGFQNPVINFWPFIFWMFVLIVSANVIVYNLYGWLMNFYSITFISFVGFLSPIFGTIYEWIFFNCLITWKHVASLGLITLGLYIFYKDELTKKEGNNINE
jgi:drug/metabolite transporter (DMT)-like permease